MNFKIMGGGFFVGGLAISHDKQQEWSGLVIWTPSPAFLL